MAPDLCFTILPAVRDRWSDDIGAEYVSKVANDVRLPAYFRVMLELAAAPREDVTAFRYWSVFDQDASFILRAGIEQILKAGALVDTDRRSLAAVLDLEDWAFSHGP